MFFRIFSFNVTCTPPRLDLFSNFLESVEICRWQFLVHIIAASLFRAENGGYGTPSFENFSLLLYRWGANHLRNVFIHGKQCLVLWFRKLLDRGGGPASMKSYSYGVIATKFHATARIISSWHGSATRNTGTFKIERHKSRCFFCFMDGKQLLYFYIFRVD